MRDRPERPMVDPPTRATCPAERSRRGAWSVAISDVEPGVLADKRSYAAAVTHALAHSRAGAERRRALVAWLLHVVKGSCDSGGPSDVSTFLVAGVLTLGPAALVTRARARWTKSPNGGVGSGILMLALSLVTIVFATLLFGATQNCFG